MAPVILLIPPLLVLCKALLTVVGTGAATAALEGVVDAVTKQKHEKQLQECLERAFKQTKKQFKWSINNKTAFSNFKSSLISFAGTFEQDSLKKLLGIAIDNEISDLEVETWIDNLIKQITLDEHNELFKYLLFRKIIVDSTNQMDDDSNPETKTNYILTSSASIFDNPEIICRDEFIDDLLQLLSSGHKRIQITGMGGLGKTETLTKLFAKLAAAKEHSSFDHIAFIRFSGDIVSDIESQVDYPREYLGLQGIEAAKRFLHDICAENNVLLCIDDIRTNQGIVKQNNPSIQYLRSLGAYIVLAARAGFPDFERKDLDFLSTKACFDIFEKKFGRAVTDTTDVEILTKIIENRAGNHTLIVNRLGNMAKDYGWSISILAERLKEKEFDFQKGIADEEILQQEINKLYQINDDLSEAEKNILEAFSIFPSAPLAANFCIDWLHEDARIDEDTCLLLLNKLAEKTWLAKWSDSETASNYFVHQLVSSAINEQKKAQFEDHQILIERCTGTINSITKNYNLSVAAPIIPFAISICKSSFPESALIDLYNAIAYFQYNTADFLSALKWYNKSMSLLEGKSPKECLKEAAVADSVSMVYRRLGNYSSAEKLSSYALEIFEKEFGQNSIAAASSYNNLGTIYEGKGDYSKALQMFGRALQVYNDMLGEENSNSARIYTNLGLICYRQGDYSKSLHWLKKAHTIHMGCSGPDSIDVADIYSHQANAFCCQKNTEEALKLQMQALQIYERVLGINHPDTASIYNNIAGTYFNQLDYALAQIWYKKALLVYEQRLGNSHPDTATAYHNLGAVSVKLNDLNNAFIWLSKAKKIREKIFGTEHPSVATTYSNIGGLYEAREEYSVAIEWHKKALAIRVKMLGSDHPDTGKSYRYIANSYASLGNTVCALDWYGKAEKVYVNTFGLNDSETDSIRNQITTLQHSLKN